MTEELKQLREALIQDAIKARDHANAQVIALEALTAAQPAQAEQTEREQLRSAQADAVMPLIGPLLDAWENTARDVMSQEPELSKQLKAINNAMEGASLPTQPAAQATPEPVTRSRECTEPMCACMGGPCAECPEGEREKEIADLRASRDFYKRRADSLQQAQSRMRDPERTMVCDILANGALLVPAGGRYAATPEPVGWKPIKTSAGGREAVRNFFRSTLKRHDFDDYITGALAADFACVLGGYLQATHPAPGVPDVLFDGFAVLKALTPQAERRTSAENVSDVLDAAVRLIRAAQANGGDHV